MRRVGPESEARYTTLGLLACERQIIDGARRRRSERAGVLPREPVDRVLARHVPALNGYQAAALYGRRTPLATLVAHVAYGTIVGGFISLAS